LRNRRYAAIVADLNNRGETLLDHPLGEEWFLSPLPDCSGISEVAAWQAKLPHGEFRNGVISFRIPCSVQLASLEKRFQSVLCGRNLNAYLDTDDGKKRLVEAGLAPTTRLFTDYDLLGTTRRSLASEILPATDQRDRHTASGARFGAATRASRAELAVRVGADVPAGLDSSTTLFRRAFLNAKMDRRRESDP
jgi:hypothetical protein